MLLISAPADDTTSGRGGLSVVKYANLQTKASRRVKALVCAANYIIDGSDSFHDATPNFVGVSLGGKVEQSRSDTRGNSSLFHDEPQFGTEGDDEVLQAEIEWAGPRPANATVPVSLRLSHKSWWHQ
jgi:hypothetical protein